MKIALGLLLAVALLVAVTVRADTALPPLATAQTFMVRGEWERRGASLVVCRGVCRSAAADGSIARFMPVPANALFVTGSTRVECESTLSALCTDAAIAAYSP